MPASAFITSSTDNTILSTHTGKKRVGPKATPRPICAYPGCTNPVNRKGSKYCCMAHRHLPVERPLCAFPGCTTHVKAKGQKFCSARHAHIDRKRPVAPKAAPTPKPSRASAFITTLD